MIIENKDYVVFRVERYYTTKICTCKVNCEF